MTDDTNTSDDTESRAKYGIVGGEDVVGEFCDQVGDDDE